MNSKIKSTLIFVLKIALSVCAIFYIISKIDISTIQNEFENIYYIPIIIALGIGLVDRLLQSYKWTFLINSYGFTVRYIDAISTSMMGNFAGQFLPSSIGGDIVRIFLLKRVGLPITETTASIFVERLLGIFSLIFCTVISMVLCVFLKLTVPPLLFKITAILFIIFLILIIFSFSKYFSRNSFVMINYFKKKFSSHNLGLLEKISSVLKAYLHFSTNKKALFYYFALSILEVLAVCLTFYAAAEAIPVGLNVFQMILIVPPIQLIQRIPISINGIGLQEGLLIYFLSTFHVDMQTAIVFSIIIRVVGILILSPGGLLFLKKHERAAYRRYQNES